MSDHLPAMLSPQAPGPSPESNGTRPPGIQADTGAAGQRAESGGPAAVNRRVDDIRAESPVHTGTPLPSEFAELLARLDPVSGAETGAGLSLSIPASGAGVAPLPIPPERLNQPGANDGGEPGSPTTPAPLILDPGAASTFTTDRRMPVGADTGDHLPDSGKQPPLTDLPAMDPSPRHLEIAVGIRPLERPITVPEATPVPLPPATGSTTPQSSIPTDGSAVRMNLLAENSQAGGGTTTEDGHTPSGQGDARPDRGPAHADSRTHTPSILFDRADPALIAPGSRPVGDSPGLPSSPPLDLSGNRAGWPTEIAQRLADLAARAGEAVVRSQDLDLTASRAEIRLHPASLGQLDVRVVVHHDQASVWLASANPEVRDALNHAMPRLEALLAEQGVRLAHSEVADGQTGSPPTHPEAEAAGNGAGIGEAGTPAQRSAVHLGLLDAWV